MAGVQLGPSTGNTGMGFTIGPKAHTLTANEAIGLYIAAHQSHTHSFLHDIIHGGGSALSWGMQQILRPATAVASAAQQGLEGQGFDLGDALHGAKEGFLLHDHTTWSDVLKQEFPRFSREHTVLRAAAGFGLDIGTDPTLPLQIGADVLTGGALTPELIGARVAIEAAAKEGTVAAARHEALIQAAKTFEHAGADWTAHKTYATLLAKAATDGGLDDATMGLLQHAALDTKVAEANMFDKGLHLKYKVPFTSLEAKTPLYIKGMRVAPKALTLKRVAAGSGLVGKIPLASHVADIAGKTFKYGWDDEQWAKGVLMQEHAAELKTDTYLKHLNGQLKPAMHAGITDPEMHAAETWAEENPNLLNAHRVLQEDRLAHGVSSGRINARQADYIRGVHNHNEFMRAKDAEFGIQYEKDLGNKFYTPHVFKTNGAKITTADATNALPGYVKEREGNLTAREIGVIAQKQANGTATKQEMNLVADPIKRHVIRSERAAKAHSRENLLNYMAVSQGVPTRIPDAAKAAKRMAEFHKANEAVAKHSWIYDNKARQKWFNERQTINIRKYNDKAKEIEATHAAAQQRLNHLLLNHDVAPEKLAKRSKELTSIRDKALKNNEINRAKAHQALLYNRDERFRAALDVAEQAQKRAERLNASINRTPFKHNPAFDPKTMRTLNRKIGGMKFAFDSDTAEAMNRVKLIAQDNEDQLSRLGGTMDKLMSDWKQIVTTVNPGYHVRNTMSDMWNAYIAGVPTWAMAKYGLRAGRYYRAAIHIHDRIAAAGIKAGELTFTKEEQKAINFWTEAYQHGIFSGFVQGDVAKVRNMVVQGNGKINAAVHGHFIKAYNQMWTDFNRNRENIGRFTHYLYRRQGQHLSAVDSADWVKKAHFDYTELTKTEREKFKRVIPFYTWTRKNIPYQLTQMVSAPGRYATFPKMYNLAAELALGDHNAEVPNPGLMSPFLAQNLAASLPGGDKLAMIIPQFGPADLTKIPGVGGSIGQTLKGDVSMLAPWYKVPVEAADNTNSFTGQPISDHGRLTPVMSSPLDGALEAIGLGGKTSRGKIKGEEGVNPWLSYFARDFGGPIANLPFSHAPSAQANRGSNLDLLSYLGGISAYQRNPDLEATVAQLNFADAEKYAIRNMRDSGQYPAAPKKKNSRYQNQILQQLAQGG